MGAIRVSGTSVGLSDKATQPRIGVETTGEVRQVPEIDRARRRVVVGLVSLLRQNFAETIKQNDYEQYNPFIRDVMIDILNNHEFGWYCHEGGDLAQDTAAVLGVSMASEFYWDLEYIAREIVYEFEEKDCEHCNDISEEGEQ